MANRQGNTWLEWTLMEVLIKRQRELEAESRAKGDSIRYRKVNLARKVGVTQACISRWFNDVTVPCSFSSWYKLCKALDLEFKITLTDKKGKLVFHGPYQK